MARPLPRQPLPEAEGDLTLVQIFRQEYEPLMRLAFVLTGSQHESEELVQDAFLDLQQRWDRVLNPAGFLRTVVANDARRRGRRRTRRREIVERNQFVLGRDTSQRPPYDHYLTDALSRLPDRQRTALVLAYFGGYSSAGIAEILGCKPATARSLVHRGIRLLGKELDRE